MKENIKKNHPKPTPPMDTITTKVVRLKIAKGCHHTSARERLWRAFRGKDSLNTLGHLLCTALRNSRAISDLMKCTENYIEHLPQQNVFVRPDEQNRACSDSAMARKRALKRKEITAQHCILSNTEERYLVTVCSQKQLSTLLELQMSLYNDELTVLVSAPSHLWLALSLL